MAGNEGGELRIPGEPLDGGARQAVLRARSLAEGALAQDAAHVGALKMLWYSNALLGEPVAATRAMMSAYQLRPNSTRVNLNMGRYLHGLDRADLARPFLEQVIQWSHSEDERDRAQALLDSLEGEAH